MMALNIRELYSMISPAILRQDRYITNITQLLLSGEGHLMRAMRCAGAKEKYLTGDASDYEKFRELCRLAPLFEGNPACYVCDFVLRRFFACDLALTLENCDEIWTRIGDILTERPLRASDILRTLNVTEMSVTTSITSDLSEFDGLDVSVTPALCPDAVFAPNKRGYKKVIAELERTVGEKIDDISSFDRAILRSVDRFADKNCRFALLTGLSPEDFGKNDYYHAENALKKAISADGNITSEEARELRRYAVGRFAEVCRDRKTDLLLEFSDQPVEILPGIELETASRRYVWLNFGENEKERPTVTEGRIDVLGDVRAQLDDFARRYAIGALPPFFVGTASLAELCLHELYLSELKRAFGRSGEAKNL